jgi:CheY-like chemotaxis protein
MRIEQVLLIDDDPSIRKIAEISLSRVGKWRVLLADSGLQALDVVSREKPDVILLDVMMPGMDGPTTLKRLRENPSLCNTPIIFMTAKVQKHEIDTYCQMGAVGVISKPFDPMLLPAEVERIVGKLELAATNIR